MESIRHRFIELAEQKHIPPSKLDEALAIAGVFPDGRAWLKFVNHLLLWLGALAIAFAVMFFIAYNWTELGRFAKFGMLEALIAVSVGAYWLLGPDKVLAKVALLMASIFLGVLLALYGQAYQTGADPWQLFFYWALLMLPWALLARFAAIWILWLGLLNVSLLLYYYTFGGFLWFMFGTEEGLLWSFFLLNVVALLAWESASGKWPWLAERWAARLLAVAAGGTITWLAMAAAFGSTRSNGWEIMVWLGSVVALYLVYTRFRRDLFMLAGAALSVIVVVISIMIEGLLGSLEAGGLLLIALTIIGMGTGAALWLRHIQRSWRS